MGRWGTQRKFIQLFAAGVAGLWPLFSFALGLGEIQLDSRLNQPLRARIEVFDINDEEWSQVHASLNWQSAPDTPALRPEVLDAVTIRMVQDDNHRHFVEVRSARPVAEPLFDLPVEVAGPAGHVIRNYSVLLDPPAPGDDKPGGAESARMMTGAEGGGSPTVALQLAGGSQSATGARPDAGTRSAAADSSNAAPQANSTVQSGGARQPNSRRRSARTTSGHAPQRVAHEGQGVSGVAQPEPQISPQREPQDSSQQELVKQLEVLQQTLAKMQETISAQNAQIADLTARVAAGPRHPTPQPVVAPAASASRASTLATPEPASDNASETDDSDAPSPPRSYFWLTVALGLTTIVAFAWAILTRWRATRTTTKPQTQSRSGESHTQESQHYGKAVSGGRADAGSRLDFGGRAEPVGKAGASGKTQASRTEPGENPKRTRTLSMVMTPAAQQKQMEADGRVQIDWGKELWDNPEWLRLFGEHQVAVPGATRSPSGSPAPQTAQAAPEPVQAANRPPQVAAQSRPLHAEARQIPEDEDATIDNLAAGYLEELPNSYFGELPKVAAAVSESMTTRLLGEETAKLASAYAAAIRERANESFLYANTDAYSNTDSVEDDTARIPAGPAKRGAGIAAERGSAWPLGMDTAILSTADLDDLAKAVSDTQETMPLEAPRNPSDSRGDETAKLTEIDSAELLQADAELLQGDELLQSDTGQLPADTELLKADTVLLQPNTERMTIEQTLLTETAAARLLAADLADLPESEPANLTEADLVELTKADAANLAQSNAARRAAEVPDPPKIRRRAGRRRR